MNNNPLTPCRLKPPTPPLHRCPSWEQRIYNVVTYSLPSNVGRGMRNDSSERSPYLHQLLPDTNAQSSSHTQTEVKDFLSPAKLPVYTCHQGLATQSKERPLSDLSSDHSDTDLADYSVNIEGVKYEQSDYALPPDALDGRPGVLLGRLRPVDTSNRILSHCETSKRIDGRNSRNSLSGARFVEEQEEQPNEKSGFLLCCKLKTWKQRYFVLREDQMVYYKTQSDAKKGKVAGRIDLTANTKFRRVENSTSFQIVQENGKSVCLTADSALTMEEWVRVILNVLKKFDCQEDIRGRVSTVEGWVCVMKHGHLKRYWVALVGRHLIYYKDTSKNIQMGQYDLSTFQVQEMSEKSSDSDQGDSNPCNSLEPNERSSELTVRLKAKDNTQAPIFLIFERKADANLWLYHLCIASEDEEERNTPFEQLILNLMKQDTNEKSDYSQLDASPLWKHPLICYSKESLDQPLTTLPSGSLPGEALKLFKSIQLFIMVRLNLAAGIDYHVVLAQSALDSCFEHPRLQDELFAQIIKQSSIDPSTVSKPSIIMRTQNAHSTQLQAFQLLSLAVSMFLPKGKMLWLLRHHLRRHASSSTEEGKYASYCERALERALLNGVREMRPSRMEVLSILLRNPFHHSLPHSIPVHLNNDNYFVIGFDGSTTVKEFVNRLNEQAGIRPFYISGYALYCDDPVNTDQDHLLSSTAKIGDIIARWESLLKQCRLGKFESKKSARFVYKSELYTRSVIRSATPTERTLLMYQICADLKKGLIPVNQRLALQLAALATRFEFIAGKGKVQLDQAIRLGIAKFYPKAIEDRLIINVLASEMKDLLRQMEHCTNTDCVRIFINCMKRWSLFGCKLFEGTLTRVPHSFSRNNCKCWVAVDEQAVRLLDFDTFQPLLRFTYEHLIRFGGHRGQLLLVISVIANGTNGSSTTDMPGGSRSSYRKERFLFNMERIKLLELIKLLNSYIQFSQGIEQSDKNTFKRCSEERMSLIRHNSSLGSSEGNASITHAFRMMNMLGTPANNPRRLSMHSEAGNFARAGSLDRKMSQYTGNRISNFDLNTKTYDDSHQTFLTKNGEEDPDYYSEIYSPFQESGIVSGTSFFSSSIVTEDDNSSTQRPPTPPQHHCPDWELQLYQQASNAFVQQREFSFTSKSEGTLQAQTTAGEIEIPFYSNVNGKAIRLRSSVFTQSDESSYSSEEEDSLEHGRGVELSRGSKTSNECSLSGSNSIRNMPREISIDSSMSEDYNVQLDAAHTKKLELDKMNDNTLLEKSGYLLKLCAKDKWKRRFFVLRDTTIYIYRDQTDLVKNRVKGKIHLNSNMELVRGDNLGFQLREKGAKKPREPQIHSFSAESLVSNEEWIKSIKLVIKKFFDICPHNALACIEGWLVRIKNGRSKRCWAAQIGSSVYFYRYPSHPETLARIELTHCQIEESQLSDAEREEEFTSIGPLPCDDVANSSREQILCISCVNDSSNNTYLMFERKADLQLWRYHLQAAAAGQPMVGTEFEQVIAQLLELETQTSEQGDFDRSSLWNNQALQYTKDTLCSPLTTLPHENLRSEALKLFQSVQLFITTPQDPGAIEYHVVLAQAALETCLEHEPLQNEFYAQLTKQSSRHLGLVDERSCDQCSLQAMWLLALASSSFLPSNGRLCWYLRSYLRRISNDRTELGQYAIYCQRAIERTLMNGPRSAKPSRMEVLSILQRNPYQHSLPHSIPVHFANGQYLVIGFDGSSTMDEVCASLCEEMGIKANRQACYAVYCDDPIDRKSEHYLSARLKLADVISNWECTYKQHQLGKFESNIFLKLMFKCRLYFKAKSENEQERQIIVYETMESAKKGNFPLTSELSIQFAALLAQYENGKLNSVDNSIIVESIEKHIPKEFRVRLHQAALQREFCDKWAELNECTKSDCLRILINCFKKWNFFGCKVFNCRSLKPLRVETSSSKYMMPVNSRILLTLNEEMICILNFDNLQPIVEQYLRNVISFGGYKENFYISFSRTPQEFDLSSPGGKGSNDFSKTDKYIFKAPKIQLFELQQVIADYINQTLGSYSFNRFSSTTSRFS